MATEKVICDTDVMIDYWNSKSDRHEDAKSLIEDFIGIENLILSAITKMELIVGAKNKIDLIKINKNINRYNIAFLNDRITYVALQLLQDYTLSHGLALPDALIAATSIVTGFSLFTYNLKDYKFIENINIYDPATG